MSDETPVIDFRDLRPKGRGDRREGPRRQSEIALHIAEQTLLSAACSYVDKLLDPEIDDESLELLDAVGVLARCVVTFREAADNIATDREGST